MGWRMEGCLLTFVKKREEKWVLKIEIFPSLSELFIPMDFL